METTKKIELDGESKEAFVLLTAIPEAYLPELVEHLRVLNRLKEYNG
jgi:hypothetical protein